MIVMKPWNRIKMNWNPSIFLQWYFLQNRLVFLYTLTFSLVLRQEHKWFPNIARYFLKLTGFYNCWTEVFKLFQINKFYFNLFESAEIHQFVSEMFVEWLFITKMNLHAITIKVISFLDIYNIVLTQQGFSAWKSSQWIIRTYLLLAPHYWRFLYL